MAAVGAASPDERAGEIRALCARLSREPDLDAPELQAYDTADLLLLETAEPAIRGLAPGELVVIGDRHGALALGAAALFGARGIRSHQDALLGERAMARNAEALGLGAGPDLAGSAVVVSHNDLGESLLHGARVVLLQLPRGLDALDEIAAAIARWADPSVVVFAGGRVKHMTRSMNEVLARSFGEVTAGLGRQKARVLTARDPLPVPADAYPRWGTDPELPFRIAAHGATFGGPTLDHGSRLLLAGLAASAAHPLGGNRDPHRIVDLGCGNGVLAVSAALRWPDAEVIATDQSSAAVAATRTTATAAGVADRITVYRADGAEAVPDGWADLILLNPPFHTGATVHAGIAHRLIRSCARALAPGGELRLVFNSHLGYRSLVEQVIGPVRQVARDRTFTVLAATRR